MTFAKNVLNFYDSLVQFPPVPNGVEVLNPYLEPQVKRVTEKFYNQYYHDNHKRYLLIGINPGRFGAGITGIPFTDPVRLHTICGIQNDFDPKPELSAKFIYAFIKSFGGPETFYQQYYFSSVSPLGFVREGKNINYYDIKSLQDGWEEFMLNNLKIQIGIGCHRHKTFVLGRGKNFQYLSALNERHRLFDQIIALPHPRWVMQYRLKRLEEFINLYKTRLSEHTVL